MKDCNLCRLHKNTANPRLLGRGHKHAKIMCIQDAPSILESKKGKQFYGKSCEHFRDSMETRDIDISDIYWTSVVKCPVEDDSVENLTQKLCSSCIETLYSEIEVIDPDIIIPMGNQALKATLGRVGITKQRGNAQKVEICGKTRIVLPIIHPRQSLKKPLYKDYILKDLDTLADIYEMGMPESTNVNYRKIDNLKSALEEIERFSHADWLCFDLETTGKSPFLESSKIVCISLTDNPYEGCVIPLYHKDSPITSSDRGAVVKALRKLLENPKIKKVAHNGKFDIEWLDAWLDIKVANFCFDTLLAHYLAISEEQGTQGLKAQAWEFTDMGGYDNDLDTYKSTLPESERNNYDNIPWEILSTYAVADVDCCLRLKEIYYPLIQENPQWALLMKDFLMPASYTLKTMEMNGMLMSSETIEDYAVSYQEELNRLTEKLTSYPEVVLIERDRRAKYLEREAIKQIPKKSRTEEEAKKFKEYSKDIYKNPIFNWSSSQQLKELLFGKLGLTTSVRTDKGEPSTNEDALIEMSSQHEIPRIMLEYRKIDTLNGMFIKKLPDMRDATGLVHPSFNLAGTVTGRLSSENPKHAVTLGL